MEIMIFEEGYSEFFALNMLGIVKDLKEVSVDK